MPVHQFVQDSHAASTRACRTTGATTRSASSPRTTSYAASAPAAQQVTEFKAHGQGAARGRHRGHPRRRLQPHRRGQRDRPDASRFRGHRQRRVLPAGRRRQGPLLRHHRHRQQPADAPPARAAADHGLAALLGHRDARRRLPLRPRRHPGPPVPRGRQAVGVLRPHPAGPGRQPGQAHRRAVGRRRRRLPGRQLPAAVDRVERQVPRHRARLLARRAGDARRVRLAAHRIQRPLRALRPQADRVDQLRHRPRRLHPARPGVLQREAQRGQRRGQQRRREPQPVVELRRRGPDRRPRGQRAAAAPAAQLPRPRCCSARACRCSPTATSSAAPSSGNNNGYCQDNEIAWVDWDLDDDRAGPARVHRRRSSSCAADHPVFRRRRFFAGDADHGGQSELGDIEWFSARRHRDGRGGLGQRLRAHR